MSISQLDASSSQRWSEEMEFPESCIQCVCYGLFDTALGNTIHAVSPSSVRLSALLGLRSPQDFCFPDGAHDSSLDTVCATVPRKRAPGDMTAEKAYFVFACYHRQRSAECSRGAAQRSILIVATAPIFSALLSVAKQVIVPFFDRVPLAAGDAHKYFIDSLFASLCETFRTVTARSSVTSPARTGPHLFSSSRVFHVALVSSDNKGTMLPSGDATLSQQRVLKLDLYVALEPAALGPNGEAGSSTSGATAQPFDAPETPPAPAIYEVEYAVPLHLALPEASLAQQLTFGSSVKTLITWFGQHLATIHWAMLTRVPVMFVGASAKDVGDAVRACVHLLAPLEVDVARFAPYATLEQLDHFIANVSASTFIAIGATNGFVVHREVSGILRCDTRNGKVTTFAALNRMPKAHRRVFDDLFVAARDPILKECYFRARCAKLNMDVLREFADKKGEYYTALSIVSNVIDVPMDRPAAEDTIARIDTDDFVVVGDDADAAEAARRRRDAERDDDPKTAEQLVEGNGRPPPPPAAAVEDHREAAAAAAVHADPHAPMHPEHDGDRSVDPIAAEYREKLSEALGMYEAHSQKNAKILREADIWYKSMFRYLSRVVLLSDAPQQTLYAELKTFSIVTETQPDESLLFCPSSIAASVNEQQQVDRVNRLRIVTDYKERVYYMIDWLGKGNVAALLRKENRYFADFFNFPQCRDYNLQSQVLLHQTACTLVLYMGQFKSTTSGTLYVSKNFMCFEAGALTIRKRHQIFPFDVVKNVLRDSSSIFGVSAIKLMLEVPNVDASDANGGGHATSSILLTISNIAEPNGLFEILHTLYEKQQRTRRLMASIPARHAIKPRKVLDFACPVVIPTGFYANPDYILVDECWENQRNYPIVGWSSKLLVSDPASFSDFSGVRAIDMGTTGDPPVGFAWVDTWVPACLLLDDVTSDRLMVQQSEGPDAPDAREAAELGITSVGLVGVKKADLGFIYNTSWTGVATFRRKSWLGCTIRRRLWVRKRQLVARPMEAAAAAAAAAASSSPGSAAAVLRVSAADDVSTDDEDIVDAASGANGICSTAVEVDNDQ